MPFAQRPALVFWQRYISNWWKMGTSGLLVLIQNPLVREMVPLGQPLSVSSTCWCPPFNQRERVAMRREGFVCSEPYYRITVSWTAGLKIGIWALKWRLIFLHPPKLSDLCYWMRSTLLGLFEFKFNAGLGIWSCFAAFDWIINHHADFDWIITSARFGI